MEACVTVRPRDLQNCPEDKMKSQVKREDGNVWIEGVEKLGWHKDWNTMIASLATAANLGKAA